MATWHGEIVEGHGRIIAASELGIDIVPVIRLDDLTDEQRRAYALVHNKLTMNSPFNIDLLALASVLANVVQAKNAELLFMYAGIGHVLFSSTFLATDILNECYSQKDANKGVFVGLFANVVYLIAMVIALRYKPSPIDVMNEHMAFMFGLNIRITLSSMFWFLVSNFGDVWLYNKLKEVTGGKYMWLRNNVSTILFNCAENFGFAFFAFGGIYTTPQILSIAIASSLIEAIVGVCDTPFLYMAKADAVKNPMVVRE